MRKTGPTNQVRARAVESTNKATIHGFVADHTALDATVYTDDALVYETLPNPHKAVNHSAQEYVRGDVHTNGMESFWSMLKRAYQGTFHKMSEKHLDRYVREFAGKHSVRDMDNPRHHGRDRPRNGRQAPEVHTTHRRQRP